MQANKHKLLKNLKETYCSFGVSKIHGIGVFAIRDIPIGTNPMPSVKPEKIIIGDKDLDNLFIEMYHKFKESNGYSELEISQKRLALENILMPETISTHKSRHISAGFQSVEVWFQYLNFASMISLK